MSLFPCGFLPAHGVSGMTCCLALFDFFFFLESHALLPTPLGSPSRQARISTWFLRLRWAGGLHPISEAYLCLEIQALTGGAGPAVGEGSELIR